MVDGITPYCQTPGAIESQRTVIKAIGSVENNPMNQNLISAFAGEAFLNLETYRKNGNAEQTPAWFTEESSVLYVRTIAGSGKVKRVRANPKVRVVPCEMQGAPKGAWQTGQARLLDPEEEQRIEPLFDEKYSERKKLFDQQRQAQGLIYATIAITLDK
jgi:PPOX class probable F420-dependent enzyme